MVMFEKFVNILKGGMIAMAAVVTLLGVSASFAQENRISIRGTNLEIPRFVTLK